MTASQALTVVTDFGKFAFGLSSLLEERARRLHEQALIIDMLYQGPCGYRAYDTITLPEPLGNAVDDLFAVQDAPIRQALRGQLDQFYSGWVRAGITGANRQAGFLKPWSRGFALAQAQFDRLPWLTKALTADDFRRAKAAGMAAGFVSSQNAEGISTSMRELETAYDFGMRMLGLTYNQQNSVGGGCTDRTDAGVSHFGAKLISRMNDLGIIVDTAHSGKQTTLDACALSRTPVVASHTSAASVYQTDRAKSDEELLAIAETGGVIGVYAIPYLLTSGRGATIEVMLDHIDYIRTLVGWQNVGIGTDWPLQFDRESLERVMQYLVREGGFREEHGLSTENLVGFDDYRDFKNITRGLVSRGYSDEEIMGILGNNFLRVFEAVCV